MLSSSKFEKKTILFGYLNNKNALNTKKRCVIQFCEISVLYAFYRQAIEHTVATLVYASFLKSIFQVFMQKHYHERQKWANERKRFIIILYFHYFRYTKVHGHVYHCGNLYYSSYYVGRQGNNIYNGF